MSAPSNKGFSILNFISYGFAIVIHLVLFAVISFNMFLRSDSSIKVAAPNTPPMQAMTINESAINQELDKLKKKEQLKKLEEEKRLEKLHELEEKAKNKKLELERIEQQKKQQEIEKKKLEQRTEKERKKLQEVTQKLKQEQDQAKELQTKRLIEEARLKKLQQEKEIADKQRKEELEKKKIEDEKKKRLEKEKRSQQAKKQKEAEKKRQDELAEKEKAAQERRKAELDAKLAIDADTNAAKALFSQYSGPIKNKVTNNWVPPGNLRPGSMAKVLVRVSLKGDVLSANIRQGSGDPIFDRSVINAVYKASPLPIPNNSKLYPYYRDFIFNFDPEG